MAGIFEVFSWSGRELGAATPPRGNGYPGVSGAGVEAFEENRINSQVMGYMTAPDVGTQEPAPADLQRLPGGGRYDGLLEPGRSMELLRQLPMIFRDDPEVLCGANAELVGLSCAMGLRYATEAFSPSAVARVLQLAKNFWHPGPAGNVQDLLIPAGARLIVVGDVHGQLEDVLWLFFKHGLPSSTNQYLFNGDIVDRGGHSVDILLLLFALKRDNPSAVHVQRGNHEDAQCGIHFGFRAELQHKFGAYGGIIWNVCVNTVFPLMPLAAVVKGPLTDNRRFCVLHGGVPVDCPDQVRPISIKDDLCRINRACQTVQATRDFESHVMFNLLWADPADNAEARRFSNHGRGNRFLEEDTTAFCDANAVAFVVRSHEVPRSLRGAVATHGSKCFTVFSASNYMGSTGNRGGVFIAEVNKGLRLCEHYAPPWPQLAELFANCPSNEARQQAVEDFESQYGLAGRESTPSRPAAECSSPRTPFPVAPAARSAAETRDMQFVMERICENKDQLFQNFRSYDREMAGTIPRGQWIDVMMSLAQNDQNCVEVMTPSLLHRLAVVWGIGDPVGYVRFLHRFQIRGPDERTGAPDLMREVSNLRRQLLDAPAQSLERLLDPNGDRSVSCEEFVAFLPQFSIDVPQLQAGALYEQMATFMKQNPLTVDSTVLCLAIMSRDPPPVNRWSPMAERIGSEISRAGKSYAWAFRFWDTDKDGYLSLDELQIGLQQLPATMHLDASDIDQFMRFIEGMGVTNRRVSMFEFVRAVAPRSLAMELHSSLLKELLKRVWICRPALAALLAKHDPTATNKVSVAEFMGCLDSINKQLETRGRPKLSQFQMASISEIASCGSRTVDYDRFLKGLHVVDLGRAP